MSLRRVAAGVAIIAAATAVATLVIARRGRTNWAELGQDPYPSALDHHRNLPATLL